MPLHEARIRLAPLNDHGGEPLRAIRPFLQGTAPRPFVLAMTAAGQSALNVPGLDTVVIDDMRFTNLVERGRNVPTRVHLGNNELLQMAGRVHGRVEGGRVFILSDRPLHFASLRPTEPEFQLAGEPERVALTAAALGVRADELDLPVPLDRNAYRRALTKLQARGIVDATGRARAARDASVASGAPELLAPPVERLLGDAVLPGHLHHADPRRLRLPQDADYLLLGKPALPHDRPTSWPRGRSHSSTGPKIGEQTTGPKLLSLKSINNVLTVLHKRPSR